MKTAFTFPALLQSFFTERLMNQRQASPHTIASYRDTFRLLLQFAQNRLRKPPSQVTIEDLEAPFIGAFLDHLEKNRHNSVRSRNLRLTAILSFFRYIAFQQPEKSAHIQRVLAIPSKRHSRRLVGFLTPPEIDALLEAPDQKTWAGRRDHALLMLAIQTGLRLSELTSLRCQDIMLGTGAHVHCLGKGRKERCTPLTKPMALVLRSWMRERHGDRMDPVFPNAHKKRVSPHVLRHSTAMELLQAGVDRSVIALWLGHESVESTEIYLEANLALKEKILEKTRPLDAKAGRYRADDKLLNFLKNL
jgi:integrase/recombinase XerD